jgi:PAS domain S-box-containing protein
MDLQLTENFPLMVHSIDKDGKIVFANQRWLDKLGYSSEEVIGKHSTEFLSQTSQKFAKDVSLPLFFKYGSIKDLPYEMVTKNGEIIFVLLSASSVNDEDGNFKYSLAFVTDITSVIKGNGPTEKENWVIEPNKVHLRLSAIRRNRNLTQEQMAEKLFISGRTYQRLESGEAHLSSENIIHLLKSFNITPQQFFTKSVTSRHLGYVDVLLVEDDPGVADLHREILEGFGFNVTTASDGVEALKLYRRKNFQIILTDLRMPNMDGETLLKELENQPQEYIPEIFVITGHGTHKDQKRLTIPESHFMEKPVTIDKLEQKLCQRYIP